MLTLQIYILFFINPSSLTHLSLPPSLLQVHFVSDFFKKRPPRCIKPNSADSDEPGRKPSLQIADSDHSNHYNYHHSPGPV